MAALFTKLHAFFLFLLILSFALALQVVSGEDSQCALKLNLIAIAAILIFSMIGVCLPLFTQSVPALNPDSKSFSIIKAFAFGCDVA
ncbi:putative zinc transporter 8 [Quercus suber]|uniref:Zinc transporter 8 n=1 Tax=Quercus suber TaxID=58331 RepID=A0AAW0LPQ3_QUESU